VIAGDEYLVWSYFVGPPPEYSARP